VRAGKEQWRTDGDANRGFHLGKSVVDPDGDQTAFSHDCAMQADILKK